MATPTNDELGTRLGISHAMASRLRNGKRKPSVKVMRAISREFGVPIETLADAHAEGAEEFGRLLRRVIGKPDGAVAA